MRLLFIAIISFILFAGCSNTIKGVKSDTEKAVTVTKEKVNDGASWVKEKTE